MRALASATIPLVTDLVLLSRLVSATTQLVSAELAALDDEGASFHPADGEWCAKEVVGHLIEADLRGFSGRIRDILAADRPQLQAWDQPQVAAARGDCDKPWAEIIDEFQRVRDGGMSLFEELTESDLDRGGVHPFVGELSISDLLHEWPYHDRDHLKQLLENTRAMVWPDMGTARGFSAE